MKRKYATVLALTFVLVGLMFFSVDTPLVLQQEIETVVHEAPELIEQIADDLVPQEPLRLNVVENPSFEEWDSGNNRPEGWLAQATPYVFGDTAYTDVVATGNYAGLVESQGTAIVSASSYMYANPIGPAQSALVEPGISLSLNWSTLENPDISAGGYVYILVSISLSYFIHYKLFHGSISETNSSTSGYIHLNDTLNQWNNFDRNITEDFIDIFGHGVLSVDDYIQSIWFYTVSPRYASGKVIAVFDDVVLYNSTYTDWIENGDFETGTGSPWQFYNQSPGYVEQSTDSTEGTYSLNISVPTMSGGSGYARTYTTFSQNFGYPVLYPGMATVTMDWKYNDTIGGGPSQYAYVRFAFYNGTTHYLHYFFGYGNDNLLGSNSSNNVRVKMPGFGVRDTWQQVEIDLFDGCNEFGFINISLTEISFYVYQGMVGAGVELLVDGFKFESYPTSDPTFEYVENWGRYDPFTGWGRYVGSGEVTQSAEAHGGSYSANITVENGEDGLNRNLLYSDIDSAVSTDFWWRLEDIQDTGLAYAWINMEFDLSGVHRTIRYVLGKSASYTLTNTSSYKYVIVDGYNQTGVWTLLARNMTADIEEAFSVSASDLSLYHIGVHVYAAAGMRTSLLVDDLHFKDMEPPIIHNVDDSYVPAYDSAMPIALAVSDSRPGVSSVVINYTSDSWATWNTVSSVWDAADLYDAVIPAHPYGTEVEFYVVATDGCGLQTIDNNGGFYYSYTVIDNINPVVSFTTPSFFEEVEGQVSVVIDATDPGSGVAFVELYIDSGVSMPLVMNDTVAPYEYTWNTDLEELGDYTLYTNVVDNAGESNGDIVNVTVVDTIAPEIDSPADIEFTVGETGHVIDWNPTDLRPYGYVIYLDGDFFYQYNNWNSTSEHIIVDLDGLAAGTYNFTCVVVDDTTNGAIDTVIVTVSEVLTTPTDTTTTDTGTTDTSTTTTSGPAGGGDLMTPLIIVGVVGVIGILLIVFVVLPKMKKT